LVVEIVIPPAPATWKFFVVVSPATLEEGSPDVSVIAVETVATPFVTVISILKSLK